MPKTENEKEYKDILQIEIPLKRTFFSEEQKAILMNPKYRFLIKIIHEKKCLTFDELVEEYQKLDTLIDPRSESTIYRSLQTLKEYELVIEIGQRVTDGQILTKTLYSLPAEYFVVDYREIDWTSEKGIALFLDLLKMFKILYSDKIINEIRLYKWLNKYQRIISEIHEKIVSSNDPKILEHISFWSHPDIVLLLKNCLGFFTLVNNGEIIDELQQCFLSSNYILKAEEIFKEKLPQQEKKDYEDIFLKIPEMYHIIEKENPMFKKINKFELRKMIIILESGPLTVSEIIKKYNEISIQEKKPSTIYRYLKILKETGNVIEVGQRVIKGKKATEKILALSGRWLISSTSFDPNREGSYLQLISDKSVDLLNFLFPEYSLIDKQKYRDFKKKTFDIEEELIEVINTPKNIEIKKLLLLQSYTKFLDLYDPFGDIYIHLNYPELRKNILECLKNK